MCLTLATVVLHSTFNTWKVLLRFSYCALKTFTFSPEPVHQKNHRYHQILTVKDRKKISCVYTNHYKAVLLILSHIFRYLKHLESAKILLLVTTFTLQKELWWGHWSRISFPQEKRTEDVCHVIGSNSLNHRVALLVVKITNTPVRWQAEFNLWCLSRSF